MIMVYRDTMRVAASYSLFQVSGVKTNQEIGQLHKPTDLIADIRRRMFNWLRNIISTEQRQLRNFWMYAGI
jgi:hypothetical protein